MNKPTDSLIPAFSDQEGPQPGPSWERRGWLDTTERQRFRSGRGDGSDRDEAGGQAGGQGGMRARRSIPRRSRKPTAPVDFGDDAGAALPRARGTWPPDLDPLGPVQSRRAGRPDAGGGMASPARRPRRSLSAACSGMEWTTVGKLHQRLREVYCGKVGLEYMHIADTDEAAVSAGQVRKARARRSSSRRKARRRFLPPCCAAKTIRGIPRQEVCRAPKRFGLDGGESMIPGHWKP